jgi:type I restriction enzyme M protein
LSDAANRIVQKLWSYCHVLRDDGLSYQDYLEQLTFLLFLKMADERAQITGEEQPIPEGYRWADLASPQMEGSSWSSTTARRCASWASRAGCLG